MIPLWIKAATTLFVLVLAPVYAAHYGLAHFLWFSDIALLIAAAALWRESRLLTSMMAVGVLLAEAVWNLDFFGRLLTGFFPVGFTGYMFDPEKPLFLRGLSLFHVFLPILLLWTVVRLGYDRRALWAQTLLAWIVLLVSFFFTSPPENINWVFGPGKPQTMMPPLIYLFLMMIALPLLVYLPTHLILKKFFERFSKM